MAINIQSLFSDIIDTPEQRQQRMLNQGIQEGNMLASGLRGRAAALAPLAQMAGILGVQRQDNLARSLDPILGTDSRTTGEKIQSQLKGIDLNSVTGMQQAAQMLESTDPIRAAALRQAAAQKMTEEEDRNRAVRMETLALEQAEREADNQKEVESIRANAAGRYALSGMPSGTVEMFKAGGISPSEMAKMHLDYLDSIKPASPKIAEMSPFTGKTEILALDYIDQNEAAKNLLKEKTDQRNWAGFRQNKYTTQDILDEAAVIRAYNNNRMMYDEAIDLAVQYLPLGGIRSVNNMGEAEISAIQQRLGYGTPAQQGEVNRTALAGNQSQSGFNLPSLSGLNQSEIDRLTQGILSREGGGGQPTPPTPPAPSGADGSQPMSTAQYTLNSLSNLRDMFTPKRPSQEQLANIGRTIDQFVPTPTMTPPRPPAAPAPLEEGRMSYADVVNQTRQIGYSAVPEIGQEPVSMSYQQLIEASNAMRGIDTSNMSDPADKRNAGTFNDYLKAAEELNFPLLPTLAKKARELPVVKSLLTRTMGVMYETLSSRDAFQGAVDTGFKATLDTTADLVATLVDGQTNTREQGEDLAVTIEAAQENIDSLKKQIGRVAPSARRGMQQTILAMSELMKEYRKEVMSRRP